MEKVNLNPKRFRTYIQKDGVWYNPKRSQSERNRKKRLHDAKKKSRLEHENDAPAEAPPPAPLTEA